ncbi:MAG: hypothetical protein K5897_12500 [Eubacterium sp.]|nr:hypothetical protein [Eubacterium sp.]
MKKVSVDPNKYSNMISFDGNKPQPGFVLVPLWIQNEDGIPAAFRKSITSWPCGSEKIRVCYIPIPEGQFDSYMKEFNRELNDYMKCRREGRCIIGKKPNGTPKLCPYSNRCTNCPKKGTLPRYNPYRKEILSLDYLYEGESFDYADPAQPSLEDTVLEQLCPAPSLEEQTDQLLTHLEQLKPRYAQIVRYKLQRKTTEEISRELKLKPSRTHQEIQNTYDAVCDYLQLPRSKKKKGV